MFFKSQSMCQGRAIQWRYTKGQTVPGKAKKLNNLAHEKTCNINIIRTWTRHSQLQFLAGLIDTDGSISVQDGRLTIRLGMQAKDVIDAVELLLLDLFQVQARRKGPAAGSDNSCNRANAKSVLPQGRSCPKSDRPGVGGPCPYQPFSPTS